jgi:hypothetical protein
MDINEWDPSADKFLDVPYDADSVVAGKAAAKQTLQAEVGLPLSAEAQSEARVLMLSSNNILSPASGRPIVTPTQDLIIGAFYLTEQVIGAKGEGRVFRHMWDVERALDEIYDVDLDCDRLAQACRIMAPELYCDRPAPKKTSDAAPHTHARLECLARRWRSGSALWHAYDRHSSSRIQQQELFNSGDIYSRKPVKTVPLPLRLGRSWPNREQRELEYEQWTAKNTQAPAPEADDYDD